MAGSSKILHQKLEPKLPRISGDIVFGSLLIFWTLCLVLSVITSKLFSFDIWLFDLSKLPSSEWAAKNYWIPGLSTFLYLTMILHGPDFMENRRRPQWLKKVVFFWSSSLSLLSFVITLGISTHVYNFIKQEMVSPFRIPHAQPFYKLVCKRGGGGNHLYVLFCISKAPELVDTFWLICGKKKVIFIHWFHHSTVVWFSWITWAYAVPVGFIFALLNLSVKTVVYAWYALVSADNWLAVGLRPTKFSQTVTVAQIIQIVLGSLLALFVHLDKGCENPKKITRFALWMYGVHCVLLLHFPVRIYCRKKRPVVRKPPYAQSRILTACLQKADVTGVDKRFAEINWDLSTSWEQIVLGRR